MALCSPLCPCSSDSISSLYFFIILHLLGENGDLILFYLIAGGYNRVGSDDLE